MSQRHRLWLLLALVLGCRPSPPPRPRVTPPPPVAQACPGGLLCEDAQRLLGWRVPRGCRPQIQRARVASCQLSGVDIERVREFFQSRYAVQTDGPMQLTVVPKQPPPTGLPPKLIARAVLQDVALLALAGDVTAPAD